MIIRKAQLSDSAEIVSLTEQLGYSTEIETVSASLAKTMTREDYLVLVTVHENKIVAWLQAHSSFVLESGFRVEIMGLVVSDKCRRLGVGRGLVQAAEEWAIDIGAPLVVVRSNVKRQESHQFYPALGYAVSKTQTVYRKKLK